MPEPRSFPKQKYENLDNNLIQLSIKWIWKPSFGISTFLFICSNELLESHKYFKDDECTQLVQ